MRDFTDKTVRVTADIYKELQQIWEIVCSQRLLNYVDYTALEAYDIAHRFGLDQAAQWIRIHSEKYHHGHQTGEWGLDTGKFDGNIVCQRIGKINTVYLTNVPRSCIYHSPEGHSWGYGGSGPHDLSLNILNWFCSLSEESEKIKCFKGCSSHTAWSLH